MPCYPFLGEGSPTKIDHKERIEYPDSNLSNLEDPDLARRLEAQARAPRGSRCRRLAPLASSAASGSASRETRRGFPPPRALVAGAVGAACVRRTGQARGPGRRWAWVKVAGLGVRRFELLVPFTNIPFWGITYFGPTAISTMQLAGCRLEEA